MNSRERLITALSNRQPDHVPCSPDMYEMVPIRLSGRPAWDMLLYQDPPLWKARADACFHYGVDGWVYLGVPMNDLGRTAIIHKEPDRIITRDFVETEHGIEWSRMAVAIGRDQPSSAILPELLGLPEVPTDYEVVTPNYRKYGRELFEEARAYVGDRGVVVPIVSLPCLPHFQQDMIEYYQDPEGVAERKRAEGEAMLRQAEIFLSWKPDVLCIGNSGMMLFNPPHIFRHLALEWLQRVTALAREHGVLTHVHCCGPERALVQIAAEETDLTSIEPLEIPPMGDCDLREIKQRFGQRLAFKGNLHTTEIMLRGTPQQVEDACKRAIDDAGEGGGFILSTGDQTPRDVADETIEVMRKVAEGYGRYA